VRAAASTKQQDAAAQATAEARVRKERATVLIASNSKSALAAAVSAVSNLVGSLGKKPTEKPANRAADNAADSGLLFALPAHATAPLAAAEPAPTTAYRPPEVVAATGAKLGTATATAPGPVPRTAAQAGRPRSHRGTAAAAPADVGEDRQRVPSLNLPSLDVPLLAAGVHSDRGVLLLHLPDDPALIVPPPPPVDAGWNDDAVTPMSPSESAARKLGARKARAAPIVASGFTPRSGLAPSVIVTPRPTGSWTPRYSQAKMEIVA
jgi:hypothetical protein